MTGAATLSAGATTDLAQRVREQYESRQPLRVAGAGTWLDAGAPVRANTTVSLADDRGIFEYVPGDLTMTVRAGTRLSEIVAVTHASQQWLPLDPWGGDDGTLGATVATATAGPRASAFGLPRDAVLGMEFVSGSGSVIRAGGRVVKNVAGFDLVRLLTGSWGTLGIITEMTVRLRALPEQTETIAIPIPGDDAIRDVARQLRALPFTPIGAQIVNARLARALQLPDRVHVLAQIGGNARAVAAQRDLLHRVNPAGTRMVADDVWPALRACDRERVAVWRWSRLPAEFAETWTSASRAAGPLDALVHGDPWRGVVRVVVPSDRAAETVGRAATHFTGARAIEILPRSAWSGDVLTPANSLSRAVRAKFDPAGILNPGIMGDP